MTVVGIVLIAVLSFLCGAAWGQEPTDSLTAPAVHARTIPGGGGAGTAVPLSLTGAETAVAVVAQEMNRVFWNEQVWSQAVRDNEIAEAGASSHRPGESGNNPEAPIGPDASPQPSGTGDCYDGSPVPASVINRESGGDPQAVNPSSGAYGCYQLMPMHYASGGTCADLDRSVEGQKACASRLPASAWSL